jgi:ATP-dependent helicase/nuclease subunit A
MPEIPDAAARERALDPARSFIVQAPAGSGKTELLVQRYLVLLARVEQPESVVAITFTRKAAGEMRRRVLDALTAAAGPEPGEPHQAKTWRLGCAARARDAAMGWDLARNPNRLRIRTIDSLCEALVQRMPWASRLGAPPEIVEHAEGLYREAARRTIGLVEDATYGPHLEIVLLHLDNDFAALEDLLASMLARRDQWLRHIAGVEAAAARPVLERELRRVVTDVLEGTRAATPEFLADDLPALARNAAARVKPGHAIAACAGLAGLPGASTGDLPAWLGIAAMLLTEEGKWRTRLTRREGFPPSAPEDKARLQELLGELAGCDEFRVCLHGLRSLPPTVFDERQWEVLAALLPVLMAAAGELQLVFGERGQADFTEILLRATAALGGEGDPTPLALALDYRIQHLLIDEFQDTSLSQFDLIERIVAGWEPGDGRTLFLVGDPMQSIYRFRQAEVGLFLHAARQGLGPVHLELLRLTANFRSGEGLVDWVNNAFATALADPDDVATGAVRFSPSVAVKPAGRDAVTVHPFTGGEDDETEAARVVEVVRDSRARDPNASIAVLVRARTHLPSILRALRRAGLRYRAIEIDELGDIATTRDLLALTRALVHAADRVSWLAILRAPWCGLTLADLDALAAGTIRESLWDLMRDEARVARLSADGQERLRRTRGALEEALARRSAPLRVWVESCWVALGGPACAAEAGEMENALAFLDLLERLDRGGGADIDALAEETSRLYAGADPQADGTLQVMSIHKAKGLEFDVVIVPGLGRAPRSDSGRLLAWLERPSGHGAPGLLLAPIRPAGPGTDPLYQYVNGVEQEKTRNEAGRLLYVAATRARRHLHLLGRVSGSLHKPNRNTLLSHLWTAVAQAFVGRAAAAEDVSVPSIPPAPLRRLRGEWKLPAPPPPVPVATEAPEAEPELPSFEWVSDTLRHVGTVVHRVLAAERIEVRRPAIEVALRTLGVPGAEIAEAAAKVERAVAATLEDPRGRWILDPSHQDVRAEYPLTGVLDGRVVSVRMDRTFVDEHGVRWIVDFKTGEHAGGDREAFLDKERERYRKQMTEYRRLFAQLDPRPIQMGLYFPLLGGWREYAEAASA